MDGGQELEELLNEGGLNRILLIENMGCSGGR